MRNHELRLQAFLEEESKIKKKKIFFINSSKRALIY